MAPLNITILGAGISGLVAALALRQKGHNVTILERASQHQGAGAAIHLGPNCSGILLGLGFQPDRVGANLYMGMAQYNGSGGTKMQLDLSEINKQWKNPWLCIHRQDLHQELRRLVVDAHGKGPVPRIELGCTIVGIDVDSASVTLEDGRTFEGDVVLGADGVHSFARTKIDPGMKPRPWGKNAYRWLVAREDLLADDQTRDLIGGDGWFSEISEADRRIVMYPCRENTEQNFVAFVPSDEAPDLGSGWHQTGNKSTVLKAFSNFDSNTRKMLSYAPEAVGGWRLFDMETMEHWARGRLALLGDAAHPFLPFLGQGGAMAIEDAASIGQLLSEGTPVADIPDRLQLYERVRHERASWVQEQTRINGLDENKRPAVKGGFDMLVYCHNFDEWQNSAEKLEGHLKAKADMNGTL